MYARNDNTGYLSGDPRDYLYLDIGQAAGGNREWLTYDEMRRRASGEWYDCFTDETCYGYNWDYDMEHFIPAPKQYANATFYNRYKGEVDFYDMFKQYVSYGDYPDFEDDEWWSTENDIIREGEDRYHYLDPVVTTPAFGTALYDALLNDDELADEYDSSEGSEYSFEDLCDMTVYDLCNFDGAILLRENVISPAYRIKVDGAYYDVDGDYVWDFFRSYLED